MDIVEKEKKRKEKRKERNWYVSVDFKVFFLFFWHLTICFETIWKRAKSARPVMPAHISVSVATERIVPIAPLHH